MRMHLSALACGAVLATAVPVAADCPHSYLKVPSGLFQSLLPSTSVTEDATTVSYSRSGCTLSLTTASAGAADVYVRVVEALDLTGVAPGTIVHATVEFQVDGSCHQSCGASGCGVEFGGTLVVESDSVRAGADIVGPTPPTTEPLAQTLTLPVTFTAGTPVDVQFLLAYATGPGQVDAGAFGSGHWSVTGLPPGVSAISCSGFVPVRTSTWGALKLRYH